MDALVTAALETTMVDEPLEERANIDLAPIIVPLMPRTSEEVIIATNPLDTEEA